VSTELEFQPRMLGIICNWCCYGGADLCGVSRFQYPPFIRLVRVMCSARVDPGHVLRAFAGRMDAVFVGGCHLNDCHYVTNGNYDAYAMVQLMKRLLAHLGIAPERLRLEWVSAGEGIRFANIMNEYGAQIQKLGPLGSSEGLSPAELKDRIAAATRMVPYLKLLLAERLRVTPRSEEAYHRFFASEEFERIFDEAVASQLFVARMLSILRDGPRSTSELAGMLGLTPSEITRFVRGSTRRGLVKYDMERRAYALA
jgi:coenzyme F420-reducing hydrogenase delta subunit